MYPTASLFALGLSIAAAAAVSASAQTPYEAVEIMRIGDPLLGGHQIESFTNLRTNDLGDWAVIAHSTNPDPLADAAVFKNGEIFMVEGDAAPGLSGRVVEEIRDVDLNDAGKLALIVRLLNGPQVVYYSGEVVLKSGDLFTTPSFPGPLVLFTASKVNVNASGDLLLRCLFFDGFDFFSSLLSVKLDSAGAIMETTVLGSTGDVYPGQTDPLWTFRHTDNSLSFLDDGSGTWAGTVQTPSSSLVDVAYFGSTNLLYQGGLPLPGGVRTWREEDVRATASSVSGSTAFVGRLDLSDPSNDEVLMLDGAVFARKGSPYAPIPGTPNISRIDRNNLFLTDDGRPIFHAEFDSTTPGADAIIRGGDVWLRNGDRVAGGEIIDSFTNTMHGLHASDNGEHLIVQARLASGAVSLLFVEDNVGESYCMATPNTTGVISRTRAIGSAMVSLDRLGLVTTDGPPGAFAFYVCGSAMDNVPNAGGSDGRLCIGGSFIGRFMAQVGQIDGAGQFTMPVDLSALPIPILAVVPVLPGDTWHFQLWHRASTPAGSNFSLPVRIAFR